MPRPVDKRTARRTQHGLQRLDRRKYNIIGTATDPPHHHRLTVEDYYRMGEIGILRPDERLELIEGEIIDIAPPGELHAGTVD